MLFFEVDLTLAANSDLGGINPKNPTCVFLLTIFAFMSNITVGSKFKNHRTKRYIEGDL